MKWALRIVAMALVLAGIVLAGKAYSAWAEFQSYTVEADGVVVRRSGEVAIILVQGKIPGGQARDELTYGMLADEHPEIPAPKQGFQVGDKIAVVHPPGKPSRSRLAATLAPALPGWIGWAGVGLAVSGVIILALSARGRKFPGGTP